MHRQKTLWLLIFCLFLPLPVIAQGMAENGGLYSSMAGLGAGLAASQRHGAVVGRSYQAVINAQQAAIIQSQAITQYMRQGCEFEATKQWLNAEKSFKYVLRVIAMRDGPGSRNSLPVLEHLVTVTKAQNKLKEATDFQSTVVAFTKAGKTPDYNAVVSQQMNLSNLYIEQEDYANAEPVLKSAIQVYDSCPTLSKERRKDIITSYSKVLKKLHKQDPKIDEKNIEDQPKPDGDLADKSDVSKAIVQSTGDTKVNDQVESGLDNIKAMSPTELGLPPIFPESTEANSSSTEKH